MADGEELWKIERPTTSFVIPSINGTDLIGGGPRHSLVIWDAATGKLKQEIAGPTSDQAFAVHLSPDGKRVLTVGLTGQTVVWDWQSKRVHKSFGAVAPVSPFAVRFTPDGRQLAYIPAQGAPLHFQSVDPSPPAMELAAHASGFKNAVFRAATEELVSAGPEGTMRSWNPQTGQELRTEALGGAANAVDCSADGTLVAIGGDGVKLREAFSGKLLHEWKDIGPVWWVRFSPQSGRLAAAGERGQLKVWDTQDGREIHSAAMDGGIDGLAILPAGSSWRPTEKRSPPHSAAQSSYGTSPDSRDSQSCKGTTPMSSRWCSTAAGRGCFPATARASSTSGTSTPRSGC
jgi:WD40 repeat protein